LSRPIRAGSPWVTCGDAVERISVFAAALVTSHAHLGAAAQTADSAEAMGWIILALSALAAITVVAVVVMVRRRVRKP
jgi:hypothetical protein